jgi:cholest-4-en-3-one 26-monooxygenase
MVLAGTVSPVIEKLERVIVADVTIDDRAITDPDVFERLEHHELFAQLRTEDPVHWTEEADGPGFWSITKHADLKLINRDAEGFSSEANGVNLTEFDAIESAFDMRGKIMLMTDPPRHTRYRLLVNKGFTPRMIGLIEQHLRFRTELIVDSVIEAGECEFVTDLAAELPLQAIAEIMGVPSEDRHLLFNWSNRMVGADDPEYQSDDPDEATTAVMELYMYAAGLGELRRAEPKDDVVTKLINAEIDGDKLSQEEFELFCLLLAVAGNETTRNATAHGMIALMEHPEQLAKLRSDPDRYIDGAVEEILRWATPVMHFRRTAMKDLELRGKQIRTGDKIVMWHISANRDEEVFDDPFVFDIERSPNDHIAFGGGGAHFCLGTNLARMELRLIFHEVVSRLDDVEFAGDIERLRSNFIGGVKHIPIRFAPGQRKHPVGQTVDA